VSSERVAELREGFMAALRDQDLVAETQRIGLDLEPISGEELQALAEKIYATPAAVIEQARQAVTYKGP
jgi:tripartite-type tricarboxylate transporter receptor subunit TctC